jgi:amino acid transporter
MTSTGGPASLTIAFILLGINVWATVTALGEMGAQYPMKKGFAGYATRFVDPALG